ncbi:hypothetical protein V8Z74_14945 [Comamonas sp. w2-DMI]|uniref:hypothetical protein n=1 Tax=Comamonas sp. w2-DMI TaxID=3126391 RepID=UPI0032E3DA76
MAQIFEFSGAQRHRTQQVAGKAQTLAGHLKAASQGEVAGKLMQAFPQFSRMAKVLSQHVGFDISVNGLSVLDQAIVTAVAKAEEHRVSKIVENVELSDLLVMSLVQAVAMLRDWKVYVHVDDQEHVWDMTTSPFSAWLKTTRKSVFFVKKHEVEASELEKLGLALRLLCFGVEDETIGRIASRL